MTTLPESSPFQKIDPDFEYSTAVFNESAQKSENNYAACHWGSLQSQQKRFSILTQGMDFTECSVLDVGCGVGCFADYLHKEGYAVRQYTGVDLSYEMVVRALKQAPERDIRHWNILEKNIGSYDIVVASGIFTFLRGNCQAKMREIITAMYSLCRRAVFFNSLSSWGKTQQKNEFYADPLQVMEWCNALTPWVILRHDYHPGDFTVYMYREQQK